MNQAQNKAVYSLLNKTGLIARKEDIIASFSNGRTTSTRQLSQEESIQLIGWLKTQDADEKKADVMRKKIISLAHEMGWHQRDEQGRLITNGFGKPKVDMKRLDEWCKKFSTLKKSLDNHTLKELPALLTQFKFVQNSYISNL